MAGSSFQDKNNSGSYSFPPVGQQPPQRASRWPQPEPQGPHPRMTYYRQQRSEQPTGPGYGVPPQHNPLPMVICHNSSPHHLTMQLPQTLLTHTATSTATLTTTGKPRV